MSCHPDQSVGAEVRVTTGTDAATNLAINHNYFQTVIFLYVCV